MEANSGMAAMLARRLEQENHPTGLQTAAELIVKILTNIAREPSSVRYRSLNTTNKTVARKVLSAQAALQLLIAAGFEPAPAGSTQMVMPAAAATAPAAKEVLAELQALLAAKAERERAARERAADAGGGAGTAGLSTASAGFVPFGRPRKAQEVVAACAKMGLRRIGPEVAAEALEKAARLFRCPEYLLVDKAVGLLQKEQQAGSADWDAAYSGAGAAAGAAPSNDYLGTDGAIPAWGNHGAATAAGAAAAAAAEVAHSAPLLEPPGASGPPPPGLDPEVVWAAIPLPSHRLVLGLPPPSHCLRTAFPAALLATSPRTFHCLSLPSALPPPISPPSFRSGPQSLLSSGPKPPSAPAGSLSRSRRRRRRQRRR